MNYIIGIGIIALIYYAVKNFFLTSSIKKMEAKDLEFSKEAQLKQAEITDVKKVMDKIKQDETNRPPDQVEEFWNKK